MGTKKQIIFLLYVLVICVFAGSQVRADTVIPYEFNNDWTYETDYPETLELIENSAGGITVNIDIPTGLDNCGLTASRHDLPGYSLFNDGFIQLEYSSFSSVISGNPEGPSLCLEIELYDAVGILYQISIDVSQYNEEFYFEMSVDDSAHQTPVPDGLAIDEGALGLYSDGSFVLPYFIDAVGSVFYPPLDALDISGITGTYEYRVDNDFEGVTTYGGTIIASVNLEQVVYGPGNPPIPPLEDPIEEIFDFVDESVEHGTLTGDGPGNSGDNRLNALINMLEEAQRLIEAGQLEEACGQLWSAYRKCDGDPTPPDFVAGDAAEELANMILGVMVELGCE